MVIIIGHPVPNTLKSESGNRYNVGLSWTNLMVSLMAPVPASGFKVLSFMAELDHAEPL